MTMFNASEFIIMNPTALPLIFVTVFTGCSDSDQTSGPMM